MTDLRKLAIEFSAQFGGMDARDAVHAHFLALKSLSNPIAVDGFPYPMLSFILRVDGDISSYGSSGLCCPDFDRRREYLSLDIVVTRDNRNRGAVRSTIADAIASSHLYLAALKDKRLTGLDVDGLGRQLAVLAERYRTAPGLSG